MKPRLLLVIGLVLIACTKKIPSTTSRAIILISVDTLRSDHLPAYGYRKVDTPHFDSLRRDSVLFRRAYAHIPLTLPSHATIFTGLLPADNGVRDNAGFRLPPQATTVAAILERHGFATGAAVSAYSLRSSTGINRGFDAWDEKFDTRSGSQVMGEVQRSGDKTIEVAKEWIRAHQSGPFFFFLHLYEPHSPYDPPEPYRSRYPLLYDGEIARADELIGDFLQFLHNQRIYDEAAIIFLSDHGEGLNDHGEDEHGILLYREALQVPLILKLPRGTAKGLSVETPAQLIDVFPTLLELAGTSEKTTSGATSLLALMAGGVPAGRSIFSETYFPRLHLGWSELHSLIRDGRQLIDGPKTELYDLNADPDEKVDLSSTDRRVRTAFLDAIKPYIHRAEPAASIDPEEAKKLQALGYLGSAASDMGEPLPDPKQEIGKFREIRQALWLFQNRRYAEAVKTTDALLDSNRRMFDVWDIRARSLAELGRSEEALSDARRAMSLFPGDVSLLLLIADLSFQLGRFDQAEQHARLVLSRKPADAHDILARIALARRDLDAAEAEAQRAFEADADSPAVAWTLGRIALTRRQNEIALAQFDRALQHIERNGLPPLRNLNQDRGVVLMILGRTGEAEAAFKEEIRLFPEGSTAWSNLLTLYRQQGRNREARDLLKKRKAPAGAGAFH